MSIYTKEYQKNIVQEWHTFAHDGTCGTSPDICVRKEIYESWLRSKAYNVNYNEVKASVLTTDELNIVMLRSKTLLDAARSYMTNLYSFVKGSNFVVILTDWEGYIIEMIGDDAIIQARTKNSNLTIGSNRSERYAGTNAIGTALFLKRPIQVWGEEHYVIHHHPFTCSSAPIIDDAGKVIGCLDITGPREKVHQHTLGMVAAAVDGIQKEMRMRKAYEEISLINSQLMSTVQSISSGLIMIDNLGIITQSNSNAARILRLPGESLSGRNIFDIVDCASSPIDFLDPGKDTFNINAHLTNYHREQIHTSLSVTIITNDLGNKVGSLLVLDEIQTIHKLVNKMSGFTAKYTFDSTIGRSHSIAEVKRLGAIAAVSSSNVLILGESGTGKELIAQAIHNASSRSKGPFIAINCGSLPKGLVESELFGYEGGSFTGASKDGQPGKFELADGGTVFLDEIGDMPLDLQASLLRVLQNKELTRIGGKKSQKIDVRIMAATNCNLEESIANNAFRSDLYYRLNVFSILMPPLRERREDIPVLARHFIGSCCAALKKNTIGISEEAMLCLERYDWPGNIRELENVIERAVNLCQSDIIVPQDLPGSICERTAASDSVNIPDILRNDMPDFTLFPDTPPQIHSKPSEDQGRISTMRNFEYAAILDALRRSSGNMRKASSILGIGRRTLYRKLEKHNIDISDYR